MHIIKITLLAFFMTLSAGVTSSMAYAEEAASSSAATVSEVISHIEKALVEIQKSDFNTARVHLKAARAAADKITDHDDVVKEANALVIQGQIKTKKGDIKNSSEDLNKALELYKSL